MCIRDRYTRIVVGTFTLTHSRRVTRIRVVVADTIQKANIDNKNSRVKV